MPTRFATGKIALGECDICGFTYKLNTLTELVRNEHPTNLLACTTCWESDHPQYLVGRFPVVDAISLRNPRTDVASRADSRENRIMAIGVKGRGFVGTVTVSTP